MLHILSLIALTAYLAALAVFLGVVVLRRLHRFEKIGTALFCLGWLIHGASIAWLLGSGQDLGPIAGGDYYLWVSWGISLTFFLIPRRVRIGGVLGSCFAGVVVLIYVGSSVLLHSEVATIGVSQALLLLHIVPAAVAEVLLVSACAVCGVLLVQSRRLKRKTVDLGGPNLEQLDKVVRVLTVTGFVCMSVALISGVLWSYTSSVSLIGSDPVRYSTFAAWLALGVVLYGRNNLGWSMRRGAASILLIVGLFVFSMLSVLLSSGGVFHFIPTQSRLLQSEK